MIYLSPRLSAVAKMVIEGEKAADIGTDHAYLPVYLMLNRICPYVIAADRSEEALSYARQVVKRYSLCDNIDIRLGDGLKILLPGEAVTICLAGMGGLTIKEILIASPEVTKRTKRLVLQPQRDVDSLRFYLKESGWYIVAEDMVKDSGFYYQIMCLEKGRMTLSTEEAMYGPRLLGESNPLLIEYLEWKVGVNKRLISKLNAVLSKNIIKRIETLMQENKQMLALIEEMLQK